MVRFILLPYFLSNWPQIDINGSYCYCYINPGEIRKDVKRRIKKKTLKFKYFGLFQSCMLFSHSLRIFWDLPLKESIYRLEKRGQEKNKQKKWQESLRRLESCIIRDLERDIFNRCKLVTNIFGLIRNTHNAFECDY